MRLVKPQKETNLGQLDSLKSERRARQDADGGTQTPAVKETATNSKLPPSPPSPAAIARALARIKAILGRSFHAEVKARTLIKTAEEIVQLAKLTDAEMQEVGSLLKKGWMFAAALEEVVERLTPDNEIRALHTRTIQNGGAWFLVTIGDFAHVVVRGNEKDKTLARIKGLLTMAST